MYILIKYLFLNQSTYIPFCAIINRRLQKGVFSLDKSSENRPKKYICAALLAHVDAGKTTLSEGLLYMSGLLKNPGRVDHGDAYLDTYDMEKERGITIFSKQAVLNWADTQMTLLDTPGHVDFSAEMERTLQVLDYAILVISGIDGVQGHTRTLWQLLRRYEIPVFLFVNKMDQPGTDRNELIKKLQDNLDSGVVDFTNQERDALMEQIALCDEELLEQYLEAGEVSLDCIPDLIAQRKLYPCFFGSALKMEGVKEFYAALQSYTKQPEYGTEFGARVFKITRDEKGNRLTHVKITGGTLCARMEVWDKEKKEREKVNQIRIYSGNKYETVTEAPAGRVCALTGLTRTYPGEGLGFEKKGEEPVLKPVLTYRVEPPEGCDAALLLPKLRELEEEEPALHIVWNEALQEIHVQVMGEVQIEVMQRWIRERYGVEVSFGTGNIVYKETISRAVEGVGHFEPLRHYAEVHLWLEPGEPGSGFQVASECSEDTLDKSWQRLILTHLLEREHIGVLTGSGLTDVKVTLIAGRAHPKHTEGGDFRQATYRAVRQGLMQAESVLLEPYYEYRLEIPEDFVGRAMTDIERMAGTFVLEQTFSSAAEAMAVLTGEAPVRTMRDYLREVIAYTRGRGHLSCSFLGYRPCHNADEVIQSRCYDPEQDAQNPTGSVFCSHGSGFSVPWNEVRDYMHIDTSFRDSSEETDEEAVVPTRQESEEWLDVEEIDRILFRTSHANQKGGAVSHKGISGKRVRSVQERPVGLSKPRKKQLSGKKYLLVDGYNIIFAWDELNLLARTDIASARDKLIDILCNFQGFKKWEVILVFDAYRVPNHRAELMDYHNIHVVFTKEAETADQYIEKFAHENGKKYQVIVATSDGMEQIIIRGAGCRLLSAREFEEEIRRTREQMREYMDDGDS